MTTPTRPYGADLTHTLPSARCTEDDRTAADQRAKGDGITLSELVRRAVITYVATPVAPEPGTVRYELFGRDPLDVLQEAYNAGARKGADFPTWLSTYLDRINQDEDTPSL